MSSPVSDLIAELMTGCPHRHVVPVLPVHIQRDAMWSTIDGVCTECGDGPFVMWEAYGYGDAHHDVPYPSRAEVLDDFEAWWADFGTEPALAPGHDPNRTG